MYVYVYLIYLEYFQLLPALRYNPHPPNLHAPNHCATIFCTNMFHVLVQKTFASILVPFMPATCPKFVRCTLSRLHLNFPNNINKAQSFAASSFATSPILITNQSLILSVAVLSFALLCFITYLMLNCFFSHSTQHTEILIPC